MPSRSNSEGSSRQDPLMEEPDPQKGKRLPTNKPLLRVLLVEDDEDDYIIVRNMLKEINSSKYELQWVENYDLALHELARSEYDAILVDYHLAPHTGLDLLHEAAQREYQVPFIMLTGQGDYDIDVEVMRAGAADYLVKGQISPAILERSIRYAMERKRSEKALRQSQKQLKYLSAQLLRVQENERQRIAAELHDDIGQVLTAIKFGIENAIGQMRHGTATAETLEAMIPLVQNAIEEVRRIYTQLRPSLLDDFGIVATLAWYCRHFSKIYPQLKIREKIQIQEDEIPENLKVVIYRIVQEAMANIASHSAADLMHLSLKKKGSSIELGIQDNGCGFDIKRALVGEISQRGLGLVSMKERAEQSGGLFAVESAKGSGTLIRVSWVDPRGAAVE